MPFWGVFIDLQQLHAYLLLILFYSPSKMAVQNPICFICLYNKSWFTLFNKLFYQVSFLKLINTEVPSIYNIVTSLSECRKQIGEDIEYYILTYCPWPLWRRMAVTRVLCASMSLNRSWSLSQYWILNVISLFKFIILSTTYILHK